MGWGMRITSDAAQIAIRRLSSLSVLIVLSIFLAQCESQPTLLQGGAGSPEELVQMALDRLAVLDTAGLQALRITRYEHDSLIVPNHPIGKAPRELVDLNLVYQMMIQTNIKGLRRALDDFGGNRYTVVSVDFPDTLEQYGPFRLYRTTIATVRDSVGNEFVLPIFGTIFEAEGRYKFAAYID